MPWADVEFPDHVIEGKGPKPKEPKEVREPHTGDHNGGNSAKHSVQSAQPAKASAPIFPSSNWVVGTFVSFASSLWGTGVETQLGSYAEIDLINGYMTTGDFASANLTQDTVVSKGMGGSVSLGVFGGTGTALGMSGSGSGTSAGASSPLGGGSVGYSRSTPDQDGNSGYSGLIGSVSWSPIASAGSNVSHGETKISPHETYNLNIERHITNWMNGYYDPGR